MEQKNLYRIGEVARLFRLSPGTLRHYETLLDYIQARHLTIAGFSREITLTDDGLTRHTEEFVTEIQIPVDTGCKPALPAGA